MQGLNFNRICALLMALVSFGVMPAQERMTFLDWEVMLQDTIRPVYREVVPLETDYRFNDYHVSLE